MTLKFYIYSASIDIKNYTIKDIPGSSGRLDVISRSILSAILGKEGFEEDTQVWVFLEKYGTYLFNSDSLDYKTFPKNEILLTDYFVQIIKNRNIDYDKHPLSSVSNSKKGIFDILKEDIKTGFNIYILDEKGREDIKKISFSSKLGFIIGN